MRLEHAPAFRFALDVARSVVRSSCGSDVLACIEAMGFTIVPKGTVEPYIAMLERSDAWHDLPIRLHSSENTSSADYAVCHAAALRAEEGLPVRIPDRVYARVMGPGELLSREMRDAADNMDPADGGSNA